MLWTSDHRKLARSRDRRASAPWGRLSRLLCLLALLAAAPAFAEKRVALVIGNAAYKHAPALANPKNDAEAVAATLRRLGFDVLAGDDLDKAAMERLFRAFSDRIERAEVALLFYAGHGLQVNGRNFLVPVEAKLEREADLGFEAIPLDFVQQFMEQGQRVNILILDACRDNPLARNLARSMGTRSAGIGRGLGQAQAGIGTLIVYATQPGNVALDGGGRHSPFTTALVRHMEAKGLEIRQVLSRVRGSVIQATNGRQVPWDSSSLTGDFFFAGRAAEHPPAPPAPTVPPPDQESLFWQSIKDSRNAADFREYLQRWPKGVFAGVARRRIADLEKAVVAPPPAPAPEKPAPPAPSTRVSTFQPGVSLDGINTYAQKDEVPNAKACQALCLSDPKCVAWVYNHETHRVYPSYCWMGSGPGRRAEESSYHTSGVVRGTAQPAAPKRQPSDGISFPPGGAITFPPGSGIQFGPKDGIKFPGEQ